MMTFWTASRMDERLAGGLDASTTVASAADG
jgi:hypothetical protein